MPDIFISSKKEDQKPSEETQTTKSLEKKTSTKKHYGGHSHSSGHPLAAYCYMPNGVDFENRTEDEKVILILRKHPITNVGWILILALMLLAPSVLSTFPLLDFLPVNFRFIAVLGWYLICIAYALESFLTWFFNVYIITDERIVDIDFNNLIYKEISDANIDKIQDVTYKMGGVIRTILNYGDVYIQTASEVPAFEFMAVPRPDRVTKVLQDLRIEEEQEKIEGRVR